MNSIAKKIALAGILAAMAVILYIFPTFPIFPMFPWLEIDFADIPALLASTLINPVIGGLVVLIRNTIHMPLSSTTMIGELSNFIISSSFVVSVGIFTRVFSRKKKLIFSRLVISMLLGIVVQVVVAVLCNRFIMIPLFGIKISPLVYIMSGVVPFNLIKTTVSSIIFVVIYKLLIPKIRQYI